jgi:nucleoside-diphosphate-sugar epimerase
LPDLFFGVVDVRDVASLHLLATTKKEAAGQRYLAISDELAVSTKEIAEILKSGLSAADAKKMPTRMLPSWLLKIVGHFDSTVALIVPELGRVRPTSNAKARQELGWAPRSASEAIVDSAKSMKQYGFIKT